jgi:hypothetical protein
MYRTIIILVALYGCEIWSLTLGGKHRFIVFENRMLRRLFRSNRRLGKVEQCGAS